MSNFFDSQRFYPIVNDFTAQLFTLRQVEDSDFVYLDPPYNDRHTDYYNQWHDRDADGLARVVKKLKARFAYSTWKQNKYRTNEHLTKHFSDYPTATKTHFYHVGATESLRNAMEEALVMSPDCVLEAVPSA